MPAPKDPEKYAEYCRKISESGKGKKRTKETCQKISESKRGENHPFFGKHLSPSHKEKLSQSAKGKKFSEERKRNISEALIKKGRKLSEDQKEHLRIINTGSNNPNYGLKRSEETRKKMSKNIKGKTLGRKPSQKQIENLSKSLRGRKLSEEHKENIRKASFGKIISKECREKLRMANLGPNSPMYGKTHTDEARLKIIEAKVGGFWYGNIIYYEAPRYCEKWKDVNPRVHAFFDYKCVECGTPENGRSHVGHHVFYEKEACCMYSDDGIYYTNLNAKDHPVKDYEIGENPNYFVILCLKCHGKTEGNFINRKKWADHFKEMIDTYYQGKCFFTKEEYEAYRKSL